MEFSLKLIYYCLLAGTSLLTVYYLYTGLTSWSTNHNPLFMKQWLAMASVLCVFFIQRAYQTGEVELRYWAGMKYLAYCWGSWALVVTLIYIVAKIILKQPS